jgi:hypothetical protein
MSKNLKWVGILFVIFLLIGFIAIANSHYSMNVSPSTSPEVQVQPSDEPITTASDRFMTHDQLLNMTKDNPENVLGQSFEMGLYLEQQPTNNSAEFITQPDTNDINTILITCNMPSTDLAKLDGAASQKGIYSKTYSIEVYFKEFDNSVGIYYKADCLLNQ